MDLSVIIDQIEKFVKFVRNFANLFQNTPKFIVDAGGFVSSFKENYGVTKGLLSAAKPEATQS
ncbi:hypothetical protein P4N68_03370 [Corynebacterium felinum]|uniref:Cell wall channel n=1 Tax=Corynebacterium felinum TaxID=131318 RepID=A0ABU2B5I0_9CORY|nr:hypothetical protein [Corynebacterium felinum]MDF5820123.1 hypothetical protein [Corynebacterium felinum]MDR7353873.1 hypothetical protein [Corynebacterium felinum]WJY96047.1 hypothetical protein CFELI_12330 [Corynebacterium felinum]